MRVKRCVVRLCCAGRDAEVLLHCGWCSQHHVASWNGRSIRAEAVVINNTALQVDLTNGNDCEETLRMRELNVGAWQLLCVGRCYTHCDTAKQSTTVDIPRHHSNGSRLAGQPNSLVVVELPL